MALAGWKYYREIQIDNTQNNLDFVDYQIKIVFNTNNFDFYKAKKDGSDVRFTSDDKITQLPFWIEKWDYGNETAIVWVKLPLIKANTQKNIYVWYGNESVNNASNGDNVFEFFDDFDPIPYMVLEDVVLVGSGRGGQGLVFDGEYFYWGKNNGNNTNGTIYKIDTSGNIITSFDGPPHSAGGCLKTDTNTLLFSTGGDVQPLVWEIDKNGNKIREWDFSGEGYNRGCLIAFLGNNIIALLTSDTNNNIKIQKYIINSDGSWLRNSIEYSYSKTNLGTPQGLDFDGEYLWYATNFGVFKLKLLDSGDLFIKEKFINTDLNASYETEGISLYNDNIYLGLKNLNDGSLSIKKKSKISYKEQVDITKWTGVSDDSTVVIDNSCLKVTSNNDINIYSFSKFGINTAVETKWQGISATGDHTYPMIRYFIDGNNYMSIGKLHYNNDYVQARNKKNGAYTEYNLSKSTDWNNLLKRYSIKRESNKSIFTDNDNDYTGSDNYITDDAYVGFNVTNSANIQAGFISDFIAVRKFYAEEQNITVYIQDEVKNTSKLSGVVCDKNGNPITGSTVKVFVFDKDSGELYGETTSNSTDGTWSNNQIIAPPNTKVLTVFALEGDYNGDTDIAGAEFDITQEGS